MEFGDIQVCSWSGNWDIIGDCFADHSDSHSICLFILDYNVANDVALCNLVVLEKFMKMYQKHESVPSMYLITLNRRNVSF